MGNFIFHRFNHYIGNSLSNILSPDRDIGTRWGYHYSRVQDYSNGGTDASSSSDFYAGVTSAGMDTASTVPRTAPTWTVQYLTYFCWIPY